MNHLRNSKNIVNWDAISRRMVVLFAIEFALLALSCHASGRIPLKANGSFSNDTVSFGTYKCHAIDKSEYIRLRDSMYSSTLRMGIAPFQQECMFRGFLNRAGIFDWHFIDGSVGYSTRRSINDLIARTYVDERKLKQILAFAIGKTDHDALQNEFNPTKKKKVRYFSTQSVPRVLVQIVEYAKVVDQIKHLPFLYPRLQCTFDLSSGSSVTIIDYRNSDPKKLSGVGIPRLLDACVSLDEKLHVFTSLPRKVADESSQPVQGDAAAVPYTIRSDNQIDSPSPIVRADSRDITGERPMAFITCTMQTLLPRARVQGVSYLVTCREQVANCQINASIKMTIDDIEVECYYVDHDAEDPSTYGEQADTIVKKPYQIVKEKKLQPSSSLRLVHRDRTSDGAESYRVVHMVTNEATFSFQAEDSLLEQVFDKISYTPEVLHVLQTLRAGSMGVCQLCK